MPPSTRIPPLLQPFVHLPTGESLLLLTSTLGASANWLITRFLCNALSSPAQAGGEDGHNVVLVSWMREYDFWRQDARKGAGLDLERLKREGRFAFVDGLSGLCLDATEARPRGEARSMDAQKPPVVGPGQIQGQRVSQVLPVRGPPAGKIVPARGPPQSAAQLATTATTTHSTPAAKSPSATPGHYSLKSLDLAHLKTTVSGAVSTLALSPAATSARKTLIILDNPDLLLALNPILTPSNLTSTILAFHILPTVSHVLIHIQADTPLLSLSTPPQPLEVAHHNVLVKCAHMSRRILGVRVLDTGVARDVSGVIRVTEQKVGWADLGFGGGESDEGKGKEFLYQVKGDGSVRVFERGAGGEG